MLTRADIEQSGGTCTEPFDSEQEQAPEHDPA
jgi:hypothetical protein